ncbi:SgcJ/EcaC family oxidoreductase [Aestuariicoccus sp. MJ-SS9]|uniref:SgcJ/EcaC family oxidoreductase n=1 Tax=Aestuariicoccus sp. MJ-SS9 TaxID=3079855 RepID=UPI002910A033|nr:SgcJ/EcaC family oxidoreductase [Aestuariicoccus sp. MJ-SS9]MDU8910326.1 SgcJ/EcaC family oxidoreductase [Aestuariicoccus sp. MJ-SS9]
MVNAPEEFPRAFAEAWATRDGNAIAALFAPDADFVNVTGLWWHDTGQIAKAHDYALKSFFADSTLRPGRIAVRRLSDRVAVVHCRFRLSGQRGPDGKTAEDRHTILICVLERREDGWLAVAAQNTDVVPGKETFVNTGGLTAVDYRKP